MYIAATTDLVAAIRANVRRAAQRPSLSVMLRTWLERTRAQWLDRQMEQAVVRLGHAGLLDELRGARRRP